MKSNVLKATVIALSLIVIAFLVPRIISSPSPSLTTSEAGFNDISIHARGTSGQEFIALYINDEPIKAWQLTDQFETYTYDPDGAITVNKLAVRFLNDRWEPENGINYDVQIDYITVNGTQFNSEHNSTSSTGTWDQANWCAQGNKQQEWLHCSGEFVYNVQAGTVVGIGESGQVGDDLEIVLQTISGTITRIDRESQAALILDDQGNVVEEGGAIIADGGWAITLDDGTKVQTTSGFTTPENAFSYDITDLVPGDYISGTARDQDGYYTMHCDDCTIQKQQVVEDNPDMLRIFREPTSDSFDVVIDNDRRTVEVEYTHNVPEGNTQQTLLECKLVIYDYQTFERIYDTAVGPDSVNICKYGLPGALFTLEGRGLYEMRLYIRAQGTQMDGENFSPRDTMQLENFIQPETGPASCLGTEQDRCEARGGPNYGWNACSHEVTGVGECWGDANYQARGWANHRIHSENTDITEIISIDDDPTSQFVSTLSRPITSCVAWAMRKDGNDTQRVISKIETQVPDEYTCTGTIINGQVENWNPDVRIFVDYADTNGLQYEQIDQVNIWSHVSSDAPFGYISGTPRCPYFQNKFGAYSSGPWDVFESWDPINRAGATGDCRVE